MKGMTDRQISLVMWIALGVIVLILIIGAGLLFFYKIPFKGVF